LLQTENADVFYAAPWSHGTLGFLVAAELQIIPAKKYVRLEYHPVKRFNEITGVFASAAKDEGNDFVEALMFSNNEAVVMTGKLTDDVDEAKVILSSFYTLFHVCKLFMKCRCFNKLFSSVLSTVSREVS
jgi:Delta24-sterol reductase